MCKNNINVNYESYYFKKLSFLLTGLNNMNYIDNFDNDMEIDTDDNEYGSDTPFSLDNTTVSSISENLNENNEEDRSKHGSDLTNTNMGSKRMTTELKKDKSVLRLNELTKLINIDSDFLDSKENPSIIYHLDTSQKEELCNRSTYSHSSDESEKIQRYCDLKNVYFTNSKYKCKHDMDSAHNKCKIPRQFQHHIITDLDKRNYENVLPFVQTSFAAENQDVLIQSKVYKNFKCPKTACLEEELKDVHETFGTSKQVKMCNRINEIILTDFKEFEREEKKSVLNLITWRYSRRLLYLKRTDKFTKETYEETEYMCRLCKGKNWINNTLYFKHLFEEHGITTSLKSKTPVQHSIDIDCTLMIDCIQKKHINRDMLKYVRVKLLPLPLRMFVDFKKDHTNARYFLQCGICYRYIQSGTRENTSFGKYFREHLMDNQCAYFHEPCYVLGY